MKNLLLVLLLLRDSLAIPTIEDNKIPTPQEVLGQPEEVSSLGLPSDEESFNRLSVFFNPPKPSSNVGSGTYHFVSSTFPEVDARGFHESVFDGIGDYFPSWPAPYKRDHNYPLTPSLAQRLGLQPINRFRKRSEPPTVRKKRFIPPNNSSQNAHLDKDTTKGKNCSKCYNGSKTDRVYSLSKRLNKRDVHTGEELEEKNSKIATDKVSDNVYTTDKRSGARYVRGMEMGSFGFHGDVFNGDFGDFTTMKKRARGSMGFHGDTFSDGFGDFSTMKRSLNNKRLMSELKEYLGQLSGSDESPIEEANYESSLPSSDEEMYDDDLEVAMQKRRPEMDSMGFHGDTFSRGFGEFEPFKKRKAAGSMGFYGDTFSQGFGDFSTLKKRRPAAGAMGFHGDTFSQGFGDFSTVKKRRPSSGAMGFHGDTFSQGFGDFSTVKKRRPAAGAMGFHGDTFSQGFGDFSTVKKRRPAAGAMGFHGDTFSQGFGDFSTVKKRRPAAGAMGFHGDTFSQGFGDFSTVKKRRPAAGAMGFHGDTFSQGFGDFSTVKKRRPAAGSMGFHGDTFSQGFGDFSTLKKRRPSGAMGFHGDTFSQGFGDFDTLKKRRPEMDSMGFHGDTFSRGFGEFEPFKKRRPEMDSMGFHGDTFSRGFGEFEPFKKRKLEMDSMGFHGDTFNRGFGDFDVYKKSIISNQNSDEDKTEDKQCCTDSSIQRHQDVH